MFEFPKWKYSVTGGVIVEDAEAEAALGDGWFNFPDEVEAAQKAKREAEDEADDLAAKDLETLRTTAKDLGIEVDGRWKEPRLEAEIKAKIESEGKDPETQKDEA